MYVLDGKYLNQNVENVKLKKNEVSTKDKLPLTRNRNRGIENSPITPVRETRHSKLGTKSDSAKTAVTSKEDLNAEKDKTLKRKVGRPALKNDSMEKKTSKPGRLPSSKSVATEKNTAKPGRPSSSKSLPTEEKTPKPKEIKPRVELDSKDTKTSLKEKKSKDDEKTPETEEKPEISGKSLEVKMLSCIFQFYMLIAYEILFLSRFFFYLNAQGVQIKCTIPPDFETLLQSTKR